MPLKYLTFFFLISYASSTFAKEPLVATWAWKKKVIASKLTPKRLLRASKPGIFSVGPVLYWMHRNVAHTGAYQEGLIGGFQLNHDRIKRGQFYWGTALSFGAGVIRGKTGSGAKSRSRVQDLDVQLRFGHTFWPSWKDTFYCTPFAALGYFRDINTTTPPTAAIVTNKYHFPYLGLGFIMSRFLGPCFNLGLTFETYIMFDGKDEQRYTDRYSGELVVKRLEIDPKAQYQLEIPLICQMKGQERGLALQWVPFYSFRYYGDRITASNLGYFPKTRFQVVGLKFYFTYRF